VCDKAVRLLTDRPSFITLLGAQLHGTLRNGVGHRFSKLQRSHKVIGNDTVVRYDFLLVFHSSLTNYVMCILFSFRDI